MTDINESISEIINELSNTKKNVDSLCVPLKDVGQTDPLDDVGMLARKYDKAIREFEHQRASY